MQSGAASPQGAVHEAQQRHTVITVTQRAVENVSYALIDSTEMDG